MKNKFLTLGFVLIFILVIGWIYYLSNFEGGKKTIFGNFFAQEKGLSEKKYYPEILDCEKISDEFSQGICLQKIALENNELKVCDLISNDFEFDACYSAFARKNSNAEYCKKIKNETRKDNCNFNLALEQNNPDLCGEMMQNSSKLKCLATIKKEPSFCNEISIEEVKDWCFYTLGIKKPDPELCDEISSPDIKDKCYLGYVKRDKLNSAICVLIKNKTIRGECLEAGIMLPSCPIQR